MPLLIEKTFAPGDFAGLEVAARMFNTDRGPLEKVANTVFGKSYEEMRPGKGQVGLHMIALGDYESYGLNRNKDGFPKEACQRLHSTFVSDAGVFEHHRNKDMRKSMGKVAESIYNDGMARIELFTNVDEEKAAEHLGRFERTGELPVSMGIRVPFDVCTECFSKRAGASDPNVCDHMREKMGQMLPNGNIVGMLNTQGKFHDISFVNRPADRIAWTLKAAADGLTVPGGGILSGIPGIEAYREIQTLGDGVNKIAQILSCHADRVNGLQLFTPMRIDDRFWLLNTKSAAAVQLDDQQIDQLRQMDTPDAFYLLAKQAYLLSPGELGRYLYGQHVPQAWQTLARGMTSDQLMAGKEAASVAEVFGVDCTVPRTYRPAQQSQLAPLQKRLADGHILIGEGSAKRAMTEKDVTLTVDQPSQTDTNALRKAASTYAGYRLAAVDGILSLHPDADPNSVCALATGRAMAAPLHI